MYTDKIDCLLTGKALTGILEEKDNDCVDIEFALDVAMKDRCYGHSNACTSKCFRNFAELCELCFAGKVGWFTSDVAAFGDEVHKILVSCNQGLLNVLNWRHANFEKRIL